jgi:ssDNA-binding Zn-finger/Zn-ribbon topoisomerase 1
MECLCCGGKLELRENNNTHFWVCDTCPIVMFEYYDNRDIINLSILNNIEEAYNESH